MIEPKTEIAKFFKLSFETKYFKVLAKSPCCKKLTEADAQRVEKAVDATVFAIPVPKHFAKIGPV